MGTALAGSASGSGRLNTFTVTRYHVIDDEEPRYAGPDLVVPVIMGLLVRTARRPLARPFGEVVMPPSRQWLGAPEQMEYGRLDLLDGFLAG